MSENPYVTLHRMSQQVDLGRVGVIATSLVDLFISEDLKNMTNKMMSLAVAQALLNHIANTESELVIREISPYLDLLNGKGEQLDSNQWVQKNNFYGMDTLDKAKFPFSMRAVSIYRTNREVKNDRKIYLIYGVEFLNDYRLRNVEFIEFKRSNDRIELRVPIDYQTRPPLYKAKNIEKVLWPEEQEEDVDIPVSFHGSRKLIYHNNMLLFQTPIMYKVNDIMNIIFRYKQNINHSQDEIKLKGFVVEHIGETIY